jgi:hypothetical protein
MEKYDKTIRDDLVQLGLRIGRSDRDWFAGYCKDEGKKQHDLIVDYIKKLRRDHGRGNPNAKLELYADPEYHLTPQLMESIPNHINHFQLTSTERLKAEAMQHFQLYIWASAYYSLALKKKDRTGYGFNGLLSAQQAAGIGFISEGEALRDGL